MIRHIATYIFLLVFCSLATGQNQGIQVPRITQPWSEALCLVGDGHTLHSDFTFIRDKKGAIHCIGTFGKGVNAFGNGWADSDAYSLFHAVGKSVTAPMTVLPKIPHRYKQATAMMWALGAVWDRDSTTAYLFYFHNYPYTPYDPYTGKKVYPRDSVCVRLLISSDDSLSEWKPYDRGELSEQNMVFREIDDRDFCVFWDDREGKYLMYYCSGLALGPRVRTSDDLIHWSEPVTVLSVSQEEAGHGYAESPFVWYRDGYYYLWVSGVDYSKMALYISEDPFNFGDAVENRIAYTPGHAAEIITVDGIDYMACSMVSTFPSTYPSDHDLQGILIQSLKWEMLNPDLYDKVTTRSQEVYTGNILTP